MAEVGVGVVEARAKQPHDFGTRCKRGTNLRDEGTIVKRWHCKALCDSAAVPYIWEKHNLCKGAEDVHCVNPHYKSAH